MVIVARYNPNIIKHHRIYYLLCFLYYYTFVVACIPSIDLVLMFYIYKQCIMLSLNLDNLSSQFLLLFM